MARKKCVEVTDTGESQRLERNVTLRNATTKCKNNGSVKVGTLEKNVSRTTATTKGFGFRKAKTGFKNKYLHVFDTDKRVSAFVSSSCFCAGEGGNIILSEKSVVDTGSLFLTCHSDPRFEKKVACPQKF